MIKDRLLEIYPELMFVQDEEMREKVIHAFISGLEQFGWEAKGSLENVPVNVGDLPSDTEATNLEHIRSAARGCKRAFDYLESWCSEMGYQLNRDVTMCGILTHDIGKLVEYDRDENNLSCHRDIGNWFVHTTGGAYLTKKAGLPDAVTHLVLTHSHSQAPEGANAFETPEAAIIKWADFTSWSIVYLKYKSK